ncbi:MAG: PKD domain-containing protein [Flavobacteriales bacterium]|nr:PKD domain-containing protein [Flavobacteriales bacterium]
MKKLVTASVFTFTALAATSQVVVWSDDFSNPANWTIAHDGPVDLDWQIGVGLTNTGGFPTDPVQSTTSANGYAMLDSDGANNPGPYEESSFMTTAVPIDLSATPNAVLRFESNFRNYPPTRCFVVVSTNNTDWPALNTNMGPMANVFPLFAAVGGNESTANPQVAMLDIASAIAGDPTQVWIRFHWTGLYGYSWFVDDVAVLDQVTLPCTAEYIVTQSTDMGAPVPFDLAIFNTSYGGSGTYSYLWDFGDGENSTDPAPVHTYPTAGPFGICLTIDDGAGCSSEFCDSIWVDADGLFGRDIEGGPGFTVHVVPNIVTGTAMQVPSDQYLLLPNPAVDFLRMGPAFLAQAGPIRVYDTTGRSVLEARSRDGVLDISDLPRGSYMLRAGKMTARFVKE